MKIIFLMKSDRLILFRILLLFFLVFISMTLISLNIYGLTQTMDLGNLKAENLRFKDADVTLPKKMMRSGLLRLSNESEQDYAKRATRVIASGMAHIHWELYAPSRFHQTVPIWENYILYAMGKWSGIPEFERYHFSSSEKSIERGIGICGDASILLSQILNENGIKNHILTVPGHVMVEAHFSEESLLLDPDFGVAFEKGVAYYHENIEQLQKFYNAAGFVDNGEDVVVNGLKQRYRYWDGVSHFITKKYYFEKFSYIAIWVLPLIVLILCFINYQKMMSKK